MTRRAMRGLAVVLLIAATMGCAGHRHFRQGEIASELGNHDEAVLAYMRAVETDPSNLRYESALMRAKIRASQLHFELGKEYREAGVLERALVELQQAVQLDPTNQYAEVELAAVRSQVEALRNGRSLETLAQIKQRTRGSRPQPPVLDPRSDLPISLDFPQPTPIFQIYKALGDAFGINVLFDQNLKDVEIPITLNEVTAQTALETLMRSAGHFYKVIDEHTILIAADTPQNRKTYEDLVIQTFFLSNAEVKEMMTILRSLIDSRRIAANEQLNAIILRDTADKVKVAERIIQANDKARAEVVVDVELLQIDSTRLRELGTQLSQYSVTQSLDLGGEDAVLRVSDLEFLNQSNWVLTIPNFIYNFVKRSSDAELLAQPRLRSSEGEKARAVIGDRVPIPVTSFNTGNTIGGNIVPVTSFQYTDVGITIEIEPRVHHNQEITLQMRVEVSNISGFISGPGGQQQPRIGTRTIESTIRLRDGETNLIAGLIRTDESHGEQGLPGLSDLPVIGHIFGSKQSDRNRTDLILTLTPHIVRQAEITEEDLLPIWVGTEANITFRGGSPQLESPAEGPFEAPGTPEEVQEMMRERIQRLPPGLREGQQGVEPEPPSGIDLVPGQRLPSSVFEEDEEQQRLEPPPLEEPPVDDFDDGGLARLGAPGWEGAGAQDVGPQDAGRNEPVLALASWRTAAEAIAESAAARAGAVPAADTRTAAQAGAPDSGPAAGGEAAARLWLAPARLAVAPGDRFEVRVQASAARPVSHLPITLEYDPAVLAVESVAGDDFLGAEGEARLLSDTATPGRVVLGASRLGKVPGVRGAGTVARITFRALAAGDSAVRFRDSRVLGPDLQPVTPFAADAARVEVRPAPPVEAPRGRPEPVPSQDRPRS